MSSCSMGSSTALAGISTNPSAAIDTRRSRGNAWMTTTIRHHADIRATDQLPPCASTGAGRRAPCQSGSRPNPRPPRKGGRAAKGIAPSSRRFPWRRGPRHPRRSSTRTVRGALDVHDFGIDVVEEAGNKRGNIPDKACSLARFRGSRSKLGQHQHHARQRAGSGWHGSCAHHDVDLRAGLTR